MKYTYKAASDALDATIATVQGPSDRFEVRTRHELFVTILIYFDANRKTVRKRFCVNRVQRDQSN